MLLKLLYKLSNFSQHQDSFTYWNQFLFQILQFPILYKSKISYFNWLQCMDHQDFHQSSSLIQHPNHNSLIIQQSNATKNLQILLSLFYFYDWILTATIYSTYHNQITRSIFLITPFLQMSTLHIFPYHVFDWKKPKLLSTPHILEAPSAEE